MTLGLAIIPRNLSRPRLGRRSGGGGAAESGFTLTGPLSIVEVGDEGSGSFTTNSAGRFYWSLTAPATAPDGPTIEAGTGALDFGFFDADTGVVSPLIAFTSGIDVTGGVFSVVGRVEPGGPWSNILRDTSVDVNTLPTGGLDQVVAFNGSNALHYAESAWNGGDGDNTFISAMAYFNGGTWNGGALVSLGNTADAGGWLAVRGNLAAGRIVGAGATRATTALSAPTVAGWYLLTAYWTNGVMTLRRNELVSAGGTTLSSANLDAIAAGINRFAVGSYANSASDNRSDFPVAWAIAGTGDPAAFHAAVYASGAWSDPDSFDFSGNGMTVLRRKPLARTGSATFDLADIGLDDSFIGATPDPTMFGSGVVWENLILPWL